MSFSRNSPTNLRNHYCQMFNIPQGSPDSKYLGLPLRIRKSKTSAVQLLIDRVAKKMDMWKHRPFFSHSVPRLFILLLVPKGKQRLLISPSDAYNRSSFAVCFFQETPRTSSIAWQNPALPFSFFYYAL
ncbi:hypothetical protein CRG98_042977 [Punica granatum]|uniref:Reverse transcriptase domain-containing protein n=1 Tax=Punica granatum TaxID=22663 RepID=A0A2I0HY60_PUNGR|nr:hypothetical protein CRG98_042977 [Punica granatum]